MDLTIAMMLAQDGLTNGAIYALLALALVLVFAVTRVIFIPQGEFVAYGALTLALLQTGKVPGTVWFLLILAGTAALADIWHGVQRRHGGLRIAKAVSGDVPNGCSLFVNIGTTAEAVARELMRHRGLRVITNNLNVAAILSDHADCELIVAGEAETPVADVHSELHCLPPLYCPGTRPPPGCSNLISGITQPGLVVSR